MKKEKTKAKIEHNFFSRYWNFVNPNKKLFWTYLLISVIHRVLNYLAPIVTAQATASLFLKDYTGAIISLSIVFGLLLLRQLIAHFCYTIYPNMLDKPFSILQKKMLRKIFALGDKSDPYGAKQRTISVIHNELHSAVAFQKTLCDKIADLVQVVISVITVFVLNVYCGIASVVILAVCFIILNILYKKHAEVEKSINSIKDTEYGLVSEAFDMYSKGVNYEELADNIIDRFSISKDKYNKTNKRKWKNGSVMDNWLVVFWNILTFAVTLFLVWLISKGDMEVNEYLIITSTIAASVTVALNFFVLFKDQKLAEVYMSRAQMIYSLPERDKDIRFERRNIFGGINFYRVNYKGENNLNPEIKDVSFSIKKGKTTLIIGDKSSGKKTVANLIIKEIMPTNGKIYIAGENIEHVSEFDIKKNISIITNKMVFLNDSIMKNLKILDKREEKILRVAKELDIHYEITALPKGYDTNIYEVSAFLRYRIGIIRARLAKTDTFLYYEPLGSLNKHEKEKMLKIFAFYSTFLYPKTLIIFTALPDKDLIEMSDRIIRMENGEVVEIREKERN